MYLHYLQKRSVKCYWPNLRSTLNGFLKETKPNAATQDKTLKDSKSERTLKQLLNQSVSLPSPILAPYTQTEISPLVWDSSAIEGAGNPDSSMFYKQEMHGKVLQLLVASMIRIARRETTYCQRLPRLRRVDNGCGSNSHRRVTETTRLRRSQPIQRSLFFSRNI